MADSALAQASPLFLHLLSELHLEHLHALEKLTTSIGECGKLSFPPCGTAERITKASAPKSTSAAIRFTKVSTNRSTVAVKAEGERSEASSMFDRAQLERCTQSACTDSYPITHIKSPSQHVRDTTSAVKLCAPGLKVEALGTEVTRVLSMNCESDPDSMEEWSDMRVTRRFTFVLARIRNSEFFDYFSGTIIVLHSVLLAVLAQLAAEEHKFLNDPPYVLRVLDKVCVVWFILELIVRMSEGCGKFFCCECQKSKFSSKSFWNFFDFLLVSLDIWDFSMWVVLGDSSLAKRFVSLRITRVLRILRTLRLLRFFESLQIMLKSLQSCCKSLFWALVLVCLIVFIFTIYFMSTVTTYLYYYADGSHYDDIMRKQWGTLFTSSYTLFMTVSGGLDWIEVFDPLLHIHVAHGLAIVFYVFFMFFVVTNIITSIFVDTTIQTANQDREEIIASKLIERDAQLAEMAAIFAESDSDGSGDISMGEFHAYLRDERVRAYLRSVDLDISEAETLFTLLDTDGSGSINIAEFVFGCMRLKGAARSVDVAVLMHDSRKFHEMLEEMKFMQQKHDYYLDDLREKCGLLCLRQRPGWPCQELTFL